MLHPASPLLQCFAQELLVLDVQPIFSMNKSQYFRVDQAEDILHGPVRDQREEFAGNIAGKEFAAKLQPGQFFFHSADPDAHLIHRNIFCPTQRGCKRIDAPFQFGFFAPLDIHEEISKPFTFLFMTL